MTKSQVLYIIFVATFFLMQTENQAEKRELKFGAFQINYQLTLPGSPEIIYDAISGDISGWWDHSFSENPQKFYIEAKPGGGFCEIFDESGDGVRHATVIYADRGKKLRFVGPLGLSGNAIEMVVTYGFEGLDRDSTSLKLTVNAAGQMEEEWGDAVDRVWYHFLFDQFKPYIENKKHLAK
jgi:hypothetical protein